MSFRTNMRWNNSPFVANQRVDIGCMPTLFLIVQSKFEIIMVRIVKLNVSKSLELVRLELESFLTSV